MPVHVEKRNHSVHVVICATNVLRQNVQPRPETENGLYASKQRDKHGSSAQDRCLTDLKPDRSSPGPERFNNAQMPKLQHVT